MLWLRQIGDGVVAATYLCLSGVGGRDRSELRGCGGEVLM
jgi:hypothetical protein